MKLETKWEVFHALTRCSRLRWIEPNESWGSSDRRYRGSGRYVGNDYVKTPPNPDLPIEYSTAYGDWTEKRKPAVLSDVTDMLMVVIEHAAGSDYSGALVEVANFRTIQGDCEACPEWSDERDWLVYHGGHGTFAIAVRVQSLLGGLTEDSGFVMSLLETILDLEDYPLADESLHSELEMESQNEAWESWVKADFQREMGKAMFAAFEASPASEQRDDETQLQYEQRLADTEEFLSDDCGEIPESEISEIFQRLAGLANVDWVNEQGSDSSIDVEDVVKGGLERPAEHRDWAIGEHASVMRLIRDSMSEKKYDLFLVRYVDPNQMSLAGEVSNA